MIAGAPSRFETAGDPLRLQVGGLLGVEPLLRLQRHPVDAAST